MKHAFRVAIILCFVAGMLIIALCIAHGSSRQRLKAYEAALRAKGEKLAFAELPIVISINAEEVASRQLFATNTAQFPPVVPELMRMVSPGKAKVGWKGEIELVGPRSGFTNKVIGNWQELEATNQRREARLELFRQALEHPPPDRGWDPRVPGATTNWPNLQFARDRTLVQALSLAMMVELHNGNVGGAVTNLHALDGLARMNANEYVPVSQMVRVGIAEMGTRATWELLQSPNLTGEQLALLQRDWEQVKLTDGLLNGFMGERAIGEDLFQYVRKASGNELMARLGNPSSTINRNGPFGRLGGAVMDRFERLSFMFNNMDEDEWFYLSSVNRPLELMRAAETNESWPDARVAISNHFEWVNKTFSAHGVFSRFQYMVTAQALPNLTHACESTMRTETMRRLAVTAIAIKRCQLRHGKPPEKLDALVPEFLGAVPLDPMNGKALSYRLNADGSFVLYSVGEDGKDDGGRGGMDLWTGADAVWPWGVDN